MKQKLLCTFRYTQQPGFTLVELMIAIAISAILLLGVVQVFVISRHSFKLDNGLANAQENARFAVHTLSEEIRMAGYFGCQAANVANILKNQNNWQNNFTTPLQGWDGSATGTYPYPTEFTNIVPGTDAFVVLRAANDQYQITKMPGQNCNTKNGVTTCNGNASATFQLNTVKGLSKFDIVMVSDCSQASIFQITNENPSTVEVGHNVGVGSPGNCTNNMGGTINPTTGCSQGSGTAYYYGLNASMLKMKATAYYIGTSVSGKGTSLYRIAMNQGALGKPEELAEGVENMQVRYGVDTSGDGLANQYVTADKVTGANNWNNVVSVRLGLLVETTTDILKAATTKTFDILGTTVTDTDKKLHLPIITTIKLRNRGVM